MPPRIAIDISPLLDINTGIGYYTANIVSQFLSLRPEFQWNFFAVPRRKEKQINIDVGEGEFKTAIKSWHLPARVTSLLLQFPLTPFLAVESFIGESVLFHWTNFLSCSQRRGKKVLTVHDISFYLYPEYHPLKRRLLFKTFFPRSLEQADHIITVSENTKNDVIHHFDIPPEKIMVIPLASDSIFKRMDREETVTRITKYGINYGQYFLYVGTIEPRKNLVRLLQAYSVFRSNYSDSIPMVLAGANGWLNQSLFAEIERSSWKGEIKILGYIPRIDLPALYSGALGFIYPSIYEGFGLPPLEAMACGAPVITSNTSSLPEVVGDAALLVDPRNVDAIADSMRQVVTDSRLRETLSRRGLRRATYFGWEQTAKKTLKVYERVLG